MTRQGARHHPLSRERVTLRLAARASGAATNRPGLQRALSASNASDYLFTGKLRCPDCGRTMLGTAATGRSKTYRYHTCFTHARYSKQE